MTDDRMEDETPPADSGRVVLLRRFLAERMLRAIDAAIGFLQRARDRIEAPVSEEDSRDDRRRTPARGNDQATPEAVVKSAPSHLRRFLVLMLALIIGAITGTAYSYRLLAKSLNSKEAVIEYLRDEITQLGKEGTRNLNEMARYQKKLNENDKEILEYQEGVQDYKKQVEELRSQLDTIKGVRRNPLIQDSPGAIAAKSKRPTQEKTGTCIMGSANAAANLAHCVEEFNRK